MVLIPCEECICLPSCIYKTIVVNFNGESKTAVLHLLKKDCSILSKYLDPKISHKEFWDRSIQVKLFMLRKRGIEI